MIPISKDEAKYLRSRIRDRDVHISSVTHHNRKRYFCTTSEKSMKLLADYRNNKVIGTYTGKNS